MKNQIEKIIPSSFEHWWSIEGSRAPARGDDMYEHCKKQCAIAWGAALALKQEQGEPVGEWNKKLISEAANCLEDLSPNQTPETSSARQIAADLKMMLSTPHVPEGRQPAQKPLFGHVSGRKGLTHWYVFMKD